MSKVKENVKLCQKNSCHCLSALDRKEFLAEMNTDITVKKKQILLIAVFCVLLGFFMASLIPRKFKMGSIKVSMFSNNSAHDNGNNSTNNNGNSNGNSNRALDAEEE
ncbi:MAG TPA: hypothetical protein PLZ77_03580 [Lachnospiraceae bacterium]|nr:hypothetical protein [Lachnospiraceae bacterium]HPF29171.1 hypothetical protein [Lachnospiraceae bacterium]